MNPDSPGDTPVIPSDKQTKFPGFSTDVVITTKRDGGEVTIGTATNVDVGENEGKSKNDAVNGGLAAMAAPAMSSMDFIRTISTPRSSR